MGWKEFVAKQSPAWREGWRAAMWGEREDAPALTTQEECDDWERGWNDALDWSMNVQSGGRA